VIGYNLYVYKRLEAKVINESITFDPLYSESSVLLFAVYQTTTVVYGYGQITICGGGATGSDRVRMRNRKWRQSRDQKWGFPALFSVSRAFFLL